MTLNNHIGELKEVATKPEKVLADNKSVMVLSRNGGHHLALSTLLPVSTSTGTVWKEVRFQRDLRRLTTNIFSKSLGRTKFEMLCMRIGIKSMKDEERIEEMDIGRDPPLSQALTAEIQPRN